jgi:hypothetical protein
VLGKNSFGFDNFRYHRVSNVLQNDPGQTLMSSGTPLAVDTMRWRFRLPKQFANFILLAIRGELDKVNIDNIARAWT